MVKIKKSAWPKSQCTVKILKSVWSESKKKFIVKIQSVWSKVNKSMVKMYMVKKCV